ncbi:MAG: hypothetical protein IPN99_00420 [Bacteroidetes bacterium]|nr:hypothetical protein [Bacteroidota bacterium]
MDKRKFNGAKKGIYQGQGRAPKVTELELIERLSPFDNLALKELEKGIKRGEFAFLKLFLEYRFGKPKELNNSEAMNIPAPIIIAWSDK